MKADDRLMVLLTAVVLVIAVGTMAQRSEFIMAAFGSVDAYEAVEDEYDVRAGRTQTLDVLSNDVNVAQGDADRLLIVENPVCGTVRRSGGQIEYLNSDACSGQVVFTYCVIQGDTCPSAQVRLSVALPDALPNRSNAVADSNSAFPTLRAPSLAAPNSNVGIAPADALASIRNRNVQPVQIGRPMQGSGSGLDRQESAAVTARGLASSGFGAPSLDIDGSAPTLRRGSAPERIAVGRPAAPQLGSVSRDFAAASPSPSRPSLGGGQQIASLPNAPDASNARPSAPSLPQRPGAGGTAPRLGGGDADSAPVARPGLPSQPRVAAVEPSAANVQGARSGGSLTLRSVTSMFRPAPAAPRPEAVESPRVAVASQTSAARPQVQGTASLSNAGVVTERAAQIIVPLASDSASSRSGESPQAPSLPVEQQVTALGLPQSPRAPSVNNSSDSNEVRTAALTPAEPTVPEVNETPTTDAAVATCSANMIASAKLGEVLAVTLTSECRPNSLVTIGYSGLEVDSVTDANGQLQIDLPAFDEETTISARFVDGAEAETDIVVRGIDRVARVAIAWNGDINLDLHALEYTAAEGSDGHVWEQNPRSYRDSRRNGGGYLTQLGLPGARQVEVYTLPVSRRTQAGVVNTQVRVSEGAESCNDRVQVLSLYNNQALTSDRDTVSIETAGCGTDGDIVSFSSAVRDITVAQR
ncbi:hypothetical protein [Pontivivens ytuae]|uniref:Uncharacterized protein n=1 Tax=Pontivivens ytuae TaxID=2789856 RepID=A0A7S9LUA7_9RHOB|nr:hypothetical protein [Pontivivens ytuae]QPH55377.1 hypothetical protein I0K15_06475 [Pontivivens ytuae]